MTENGAEARVTGLRDRAVDEPMRRPLPTARLLVGTASLALVRIQADGGSAGLSCLFYAAGAPLEPVGATLEAIAASRGGGRAPLRGPSTSAR
ncbi:MAG: hypothetical protein M5U08_04710 [Burkholderiales bacterium]|nr:hypothetical protein [Burkholderiales bacterium]